MRAGESQRPNDMTDLGQMEWDDATKACAANSNGDRLEVTIADNELNIFV